MELTKSFRETVLERMRADPAFRREVLHHAAELIQAGDVATGRAMLRDCITAAKVPQNW